MLNAANLKQLNKSNTKEEINESKHILFNKHLGDKRLQNNKPYYKNRINLRRDISDDGISSNYPNSSLSTCRDTTYSSISSAQTSSAAINEDLDSSLKETDADISLIQSNNSLAPSESFEYDNSQDRLRIRQMESLWAEHKMENKERTWKSPQRERKFMLQQKRMTDYLKHKNKKNNINSLKDLDSESESSDGGSESDHSFTFKDIAAKAKVHEAGYMSDSSPSTVKSYSHKCDLMSSQDTSPINIVYGTSSLNRPVKRMLNMITAQRDSESVSSTLQSHLSGYSDNYLARANKFGTVINAIRKPGHHVGPAKNPDCQCEHCRHWIAERDQGMGRGRALSFGDTPFSRPGFWLKRNSNIAS